MLSDRHVLFIGYVMGTALRYGVRLVPIVDDDGAYTRELYVHLDDALGNVIPNLTLVVPEPAEDWKLPQ